jgi:putative PIN family toxin of toxin-antitoxin system
MRAVFDTCVLYSALRSSSGASHRILKSLPNPNFRPMISTPVFFEYEEVLRRPKQFPHLSSQDIEDFLDFIASVCDPVRINFLWRPHLSDPDDDLILELAVSGRADAIVTFNQRDFVGSDQFGIRVMSPKELIKEISI